jgi:two-component system chemotaxis sensor kinase CheA
MADLLDLSEFLTGYLAEVDDHLSAANANLLAVEKNLERGQSHPRAVRDLFRSLHTIKGLSGMVGVDPVVDLAHAMEAILRTGDRSGGALHRDAIDVLMKGLRAIEQRVRAVANGAPVASAPLALLRALEGIEPAAAADTAGHATELTLEEALAEKLTLAEKEQLSQGIGGGRRALRVDYLPSADRAAEGTTITSVRERLGKLAEIVKVIPRSVPATDSAPGGLAFTLLILTTASDDEIAGAAATSPEAVTSIGAALRPPPSAGGEAIEPVEDEVVANQPARRGVVRVDVARLDDVMEKLSALVVTGFRLSRAVAEMKAKGVDVRELAVIVHENGHELGDLRGSIMRARMIPVSEALERIPLLVRGLVASSGKAVRLEIDARHAELDKAVAERIFPAIVHLVRNAVDHAIEPKEERQRQGKPDEALIRVACFERSANQLELSVSDDGRGVDRQRVAARAGKPVPQTDDALLAMLTLPGLSTLDTATTTSGRGLGMDIVRRIAVDDLGGELKMETTPGRGTTFFLRVPLTITIVDAFSFRCGDQPFVVPVSSVDEIIEMDTAHIINAPGSPGRRRGEVRILERRGIPVPVVSLERLLELPQTTRANRKAIIVRRDGAPYAFEIDQMLGQQEVVVRPIVDPLVRAPGVSGSTDLGDGRPTLVLDLVALSATIGGGRRRAFA